MKQGEPVDCFDADRSMSQADWANKFNGTTPLHSGDEERGLQVTKGLAFFSLHSAKKSDGTPLSNRLLAFRMLQLPSANFSPISQISRGHMNDSGVHVFTGQSPHNSKGKQGQSWTGIP